jgi:uncharacterized membrane protein YagU involved in acid resistance
VIKSINVVCQIPKERTLMSRVSINRSILQRILIAGTIAAVLDAAFAFVAYVVIDGRYNFESLLQYIASGLLGHDAFVHHGFTGWLIAALGFVLHFGISLSVAAVFYVVLRRFANTPGRAVTVGLLYGAAVWMFNTAVVLPLTDIRHEPFFGGWYIPFLVDHALFVGLPIALMLAKGKWETVSAGGHRALRLVTAH